MHNLRIGGWRTDASSQRELVNLSNVGLYRWLGGDDLDKLTLARGREIWDHISVLHRRWIIAFTIIRQLDVKEVKLYSLLSDVSDEGLV